MNPSDIFDTSSHFFSIFAVIGLGWWLSGRFRIVEETARDIGSSIKSELIQHEEEDARRFEKIHIAIARMGNGLKSYNDEGSLV